MSDSGDAVAGAINKRVEAEFVKLQTQSKEFFDKREQDISKYDRELRDRTEERLRVVEDRVTRDVRTRIFSLVLAVVVAAAGVMLAGSFAATREVNNSVISLQNTIIATQNTIKGADKALAEQSKKLAEASISLTIKAAELEAASGRLREVTKQLEDTRKELAKARTDYERLSKPSP